MQVVASVNQKYNAWRLEMSQFSESSSGLEAVSLQDFLEKATSKYSAKIVCPEHVLRAFQALMEKHTAFLGRSFYNPYTNEREQIPETASDLTARHLQMFARNESYNVSGVMQETLYHKFFSSDEIATLRALVKETTVVGSVQMHSYGGYPSSHNNLPVKLQCSMDVILVEQSGLQWQGDLRNTGGMFFYPQSQDSDQKYSAWQEEMYQSLYGIDRPKVSNNTMKVTWKIGREKPLEGVIDLDSLALGFKSEFLLAMRSLAIHDESSTSLSKPIHFRFLKAGMGFFCEGIAAARSSNLQSLEIARLTGILAALKEIEKVPSEERHYMIGAIRALELPFSDMQADDGKKLLVEIAAALNPLGITWAGAGSIDALAPLKDSAYRLATTTCGDPHAVFGNEGGYNSVDAMIATNMEGVGLIAALKPDMECVYYETMQAQGPATVSRGAVAKPDPQPLTLSTAGDSSGATVAASEKSIALPHEGKGGGAEGGLNRK